MMISDVFTSAVLNKRLLTNWFEYFGLGLYMKFASFIIIQYSGKDARGIEPWQAAPVDRAVAPD